MRASRRFVMVLLVLTAGSLPSLAGEEPAGASSATVRIELLRTRPAAELYPLLPVFLKVRVVNESDSPLWVPPPFAADSGGWSWLWHRFQVFVAEGEGGILMRRYPTSPFQQPQDLGMAMSRYRVLQPPQSTAEYEFVLGSGDVKKWGAKPGEPNPETTALPPIARRALFWKPGIFRIKVGMYFDGSGIRELTESNELSIEIAEPTGRNKAVHDLLLRSSYPWQFCNPSLLGARHDTCATYREIAREFTDTAYYPYAKLAVAEEMCRIDVITLTALPPADPILGMELLEEMAKDPECPLADRALVALAGKISSLCDAWIEVNAGSDDQKRINLMIMLRNSPENIDDPVMKRAAESRVFVRKAMRAALPAEENSGNLDDEEVTRRFRKNLQRKYGRVPK